MNDSKICLDNDCSIRVYQWFAAIFKKVSYYSGIMLNAFSDPLCSQFTGISWSIIFHNWQFYAVVSQLGIVYIEIFK